MVTLHKAVRVELSSGTFVRTFYNVPLSLGDKGANIFQAEVFDNGAKRSFVSGDNCIGYFIRPDGDTVICPGVLSGNVASVTLPESCYVEAGGFTFAIKVYTASLTCTLAVFDGTVATTSTNAIIDPGHLVPTVAELEALIARAEAASAVINRVTISANLISGSMYNIVIRKTS